MEDLLKMIESVDPSDEAALDKIDQTVLRYIFLVREAPFVRANHERCLEINSPRNKFTRSRDALKAIRPDAIKVWALFDGYKEGAKYRAEIFIAEGIGKQVIQTDWLPTEELAELHGIIRAIKYMRQSTARSDDAGEEGE